MKTNYNPTTKRSILKYILFGLALCIGLLTIYMMHPLFGKKPSGERLARIIQSENYHDGKFRNKNDTRQLTQGLGTALYEFFFKRNNEVSPKEFIPSINLDWDHWRNETYSLTWLGHSTYLMKVDGKTILVDPVLSQSVSPIPGGGKAYKGTSVTKAEELPYIDFMFISHDHYDHLDYETVKKIQSKVGKVICGLGVGSHLEYWGFKSEQIIETDWWDITDLEADFKVITTPARHFSGRSIWSGNTLWTSFVFQTPSRNIYIGGDSGYDTHFKEIGAKYGPFDLVILENGQYDKNWKYIHMQPEEVIAATKDLKASILLPVHSSKFTLANHAWYEPLERISILSEQEKIAVLTPLIGEIVDLNNPTLEPTYWWKN